MEASETSVCNPVTRRLFLRASVAGAVAVAAGPALAQQPAPAQQAPRVKGPLVWLDMDQKELDDAYDQSVWASNRPQIFGRYATNSEGVRARLGAPQRHAYGPTAIEALDVYLTKRPNAPINIFIHGGAWRDQVAKDWAFPAELFVHSGAHYVVPDFAWVQDVGGSLLPMAEQVRRAGAGLVDRRLGARAPAPHPRPPAAPRPQIQLHSSRRRSVAQPLPRLHPARVQPTGLRLAPCIHTAML